MKRVRVRYAGRQTVELRPPGRFEVPSAAVAQVCSLEHLRHFLASDHCEELIRCGV